MPDTNSPLTRSIGIAGVIRFVIAIAAVIAISDAFAERRYALAAAGLIFLGIVMVLAYLLWRSRRTP